MTTIIRGLACAVALMLPVAGVCQSPGSAAPSLVTPRLRVAVMDLTGSALKMQTTQAPAPGGGGTTQTTISIPPPSEFARSLTEALTTSLVATAQFVVLERMALAQVQQEQDLGASGRVNKETAADGGKLMGAQVLITGDIMSFAFKRSAVGGKLTNLIKGLNAGVERVSASVSIDLRIIDAVTGEVIASIKGDGDAAQNGVSADLTRDEKKYDGSMSLSTPLGKASRDAIQESIAGIVANIPKMKWNARVIDFRVESLAQRMPRVLFVGVGPQQARHPLSRHTALARGGEDCEDRQSLRTQPRRRRCVMPLEGETSKRQKAQHGSNMM